MDDSRSPTGMLRTKAFCQISLKILYANPPWQNQKTEQRLARIGLWHEIQNRVKYTWFDVVFHADSDSIFFLF